VTRLRLLRWLLEIFGPSTKACARHNFRRLGLTNSIRAFIRALGKKSVNNNTTTVGTPDRLVLGHSNIGDLGNLRAGANEKRGIFTEVSYVRAQKPLLPY